MADLAIVVGAGGDIGGRCSRELATTVDRVLCVDRDATAAASAVVDVRSRGCEATALVADSTGDGFASAVAEGVEGDTVRVALYAVAFEEHRPAEQLTPASLARSFAAGPLAAFALFRELRSRSMLGEGSSLIAIGSLHATAAFAGTLGYNLAQAAMASLVQSLAHEWAAERIRVNEVVPGWTRTRGEVELYDEAELDRRSARLPFGRMGSVDDIAAAVTFLASDAAGYISGARLVVDGALSASLAALPGGDM